MPSSGFLLSARWVLPITSPPILGGWVRTFGHQVIEFGRGTAPPGPADETVIDLGDAALIPALVNAHTHLEFSDCDHPIGTSGMPLARWIGQVVKSRQSAAPEERSNIVARGLQESALAATGLIGEIATPPCAYPSDVATEVIPFSETLGLSAERSEERLSAADEFMAGNSVAGISPHAPYSTPWSVIRTCVDLAIRFGRPLAMHVAESPAERELLQCGEGPFANALSQMGLPIAEFFPWSDGRNICELIEMLATAPRCLLVHGNDLTDREMDVAAKHQNLSVVYCARTHHFFGYTPHPVLELLRRGIRVALGTDSRASNPDLSIWNEIRFLLDRRPDISPDTVLRMATAWGADALGSKRHGRIEVGASPGFATIETTAQTVSALFADFSERSAARLNLPSFGSP